MITDIQKSIILELLKPYDPKRVGVFGSFARSEEKDHSDLDLIVELGKQIDLLELIGIELELTELLGIKVDLITEQSLSKHLKPFVEKEIEYILNEEK